MMRRAAGCALSASVCLAAALAAQEPASTFLPIGDWRARFAEHLITAGVVEDPAPFERPLRRAALLRAIPSADTTLARQVSALLGRLRGDLPGPRDGEALLAADLGVGGGSQSRRDPLRPAGRGYVAPLGGIDVEAALGRLAIAVHPYFDNRLKTDPDWHGFTRRVVAGRQAESYLALQLGPADMAFGTVDQNWGPPAIQGLMLSDAPYGYDRFSWGLTTRKARLHGFVAQLDDYVDGNAEVWRRWYVGTRLALLPSDKVMVAIWQGSLVSGLHRGLDLWYLNPLNLTYVVQANEDSVVDNSNQVAGLDVQVGLGHRTRLFGQLLLDDAQVDRKAQTDAKPVQAGVTLGAGGGLHGGAVAWTVFYTAVTNLTYRTQRGVVEEIREHRVGLARNLADYDQFTARVSWLALNGLLLAPELTILRRGEGDFRQPMPLPSAWPETKTILSGVVERTARAAVRADYAAPSGFFGWVDAGVHHLTNRAHVGGVTATRMVWNFGLGWRREHRLNLR